MKNDLLHYYRLYSGKRQLTVQEKESILEAVISEHRAAHRSSLFSLSWGALRPWTKVLAAACLLLVAAPLIYLSLHRPAETDAYFARGEADTDALYVQCREKSGAQGCNTGDVLLFKIHAVSSYRYFSAFSRHRKNGAVIWYYPATESGKSILIDAGGKSGVLTDGISVGAEHRPGTYDVFGILSARPLDRKAIRSFFENDTDESSDTTKTDRVVVKTEVVIR